MASTGEGARRGRRRRGWSMLTVDVIDRGVGRYQGLEGCGGSGVCEVDSGDVLYYMDMIMQVDRVDLEG